MPGAIANAGASIATRRKLFYMVCVPLRLSLAYGLFKYSANENVRMIALIISLLTSAHLFMKYRDNTDPVWWNRKYHAISSMIITILAAFNRLDLASLTMVSDVIFGLISSRKGFEE